MSGPRFFITDVFATDRYTGNQLATVLPDGRMSDDEMQSVAAEFGFSETTFVLSGEPIDGGYPVRIFTPKTEIGFAGHPTLGTAFVLRRHVIGTPIEQVFLNLAVGTIPVRCPNADDEDGLLWMSQNQPEFEDGIDPEDMAAVLGLDVGEIDARWPISQVTTGLPFTIVPVTSAHSLAKARINTALYEQWTKSVWAKGILVFWLGGYTETQDLAARVFVPYLGVPEDPATGSANGCLAAYLLRHAVLGSDTIDVRIGQGYEIGRPSEILIRAHCQAGQYQIDVGGRVIEVASGMLED